MKTYVTNNAATGRPSTSDQPAWISGKQRGITRLRGRKRSLPYLALGVVLVIACAGTFLWISLTANDRRPVLALNRPVTVGHILTPQDLQQVNVAVDAGVLVVDAGQATSVVGKTMAVSLSAGTLLTSDSVATPAIPVAGQSIAALALKAGQFPVEVGTGARVSVVLVPNGSQPSAVVAETSTSWPGVVTSMSSPANEQVTVVSVQVAEAAARQIAAVPAGQLALVLLPGGGR
ncbi:SAF domain-containing protein [Lentzea flava]|uniref:SAF domain-containing protein n=1 Tax=Lentzea flava TaxID=103732 RepID=A0ABQ2UJA0_9PSEU|nr:SAF domain-containing protein [Lentzea flava]MCP2199947.1 Chaperone for flagella basal body P-ring formation [Lentzea flava]GGU39767.1 hypothetical protein GCM10010178_35140 [Lentzea flava]